MQESMTAMQKSVDRATQLEKELQATRVEVAEAKAALKAAEKEMAALSKRLEAAVASEEKSVAEARKAQVGWVPSATTPHGMEWAGEGRGFFPKGGPAPTRQL